VAKSVLFLSEEEWDSCLRPNLLFFGRRRGFVPLAKSSFFLVMNWILVCCWILFFFEFVWLVDLFVDLC